MFGRDAELRCAETALVFAVLPKRNQRKTAHEIRVAEGSACYLIRADCHTITGEFMAQELALGVIASLGTDARAALQHVRSLGLPTAQISYPAALDNEAGLREIDAARMVTGVEVTTVFCGFAGESY